MRQFEALLSDVIDSTLGSRCKYYGYRYSEIIRSLMCVYFCGGSCIEDISVHLMRHLFLHPRLRTCSADTIHRAIRELTCENTVYRSDSDRVYELNAADKVNGLLVKALLSTGLWKGGYTYRCILTNDFVSTTHCGVLQPPGGKDRIFDEMNNGFGWNRLPKSFMAENTVFLLMTALIRNFCKTLIMNCCIPSG